VAVVQYTYTHKHYVEQHKKYIEQHKEYIEQHKEYIEQHKKYIEQHKKYIEQHKKWEESGSCPLIAGFALAFALQLREKHGKTSVRVVIHKHTVRIYSHNNTNYIVLLVGFTIESLYWNSKYMMFEVHQIEFSILIHYSQFVNIS
jgi:hypothetical protein